MTALHPVIKKLQWKESMEKVLIMNAPREYEEITKAFPTNTDQNVDEEEYDFVQVFGKTNEELQQTAKNVADKVTEDGLFWLCYPKKASKAYKSSDCSRESVTGMLKDELYEPVRQVSTDEDWSALRFRKVDKIKKITRNFAVTAEGKKRADAEGTE